MQPEYLLNLPFSDNDEDFVFDEPMRAVVPQGSFLRFLFSPWGVIGIEEVDTVPKVRVNNNTHPFSGSPKSGYDLARLAIVDFCRHRRWKNKENHIPLTYGLEYLYEAVDQLTSNNLLVKQIYTNIGISDSVRRSHDLEGAEIICDPVNRGFKYIILMPEKEFVGVYSESADGKYCRIGIKADCKAVLMEGN